MAGDSLTTIQKYVAAKALKYGRGYIGEDRENSRGQIERFLGIYDLGFADENGKPYAFCAAGASYCFIKAWLDVTGVKYTSDNIMSVIKTNLSYFDVNIFPASPSCGSLVASAKHQGRWRRVGDFAPKQGWLVFFDFLGKGYATHVEIVETFTSQEITDVGFNTTAEHESNGGAVAERVRSYNHVLGYYATW